MPTIPTRPASGAIVATAWGGDIHDRAFTPQGAQGSGAGLSVTTEAKLPLDTLGMGNPAYLDVANSQLKVPANGAGLYALAYTIGIASTALYVRARLFRNGAAFSGGGASFQGSTSVTQYMGASLVLALSDLDTLEIRGSADAADAATLTIVRFSIVRIGDALATSGP